MDNNDVTHKLLDSADIEGISNLCAHIGMFISHSAVLLTSSIQEQGWCLTT